MGHSSPAVSKHEREGKGEKSESSSCVCTEVMHLLNPRRITVQNPATGQDLCTYALRFSSPEFAFPIANAIQCDFSFAFRCTNGDPSCPFCLQGGLLVENTHRCAVVCSLESSSDA